MQSDIVREALRALPYSLAALFAYHVYSVACSSDGNEPTIAPSPKDAVSKLSESEQDNLPYPPNCIPGGRDISTPYGSIRAYEFGPIDGPKVLLVHGISTPCISLAHVARHLVDSGHRVMLFDLFGRGYSASPSLPQDLQLFTTQIHLVLASSPLHWDKYHLVGYSLGGGIAAGFTSYFPQQVASLTLIAPAGLIREARMGFVTKVMRSGALPEPVIDAIVRRRLLGRAKQSTDPEVPHPALKPDSDVALYADRPGVSVADAVAWQVGSNAGFVRAFVSSIAHAPITGQHQRWTTIGERLADERRAGRTGKVLMVLGKTDDVIVGEELVPDATAVLGEEALQVEWLDAGHDVPIVKAEAVATLIASFCKAS